MMRVTRLQVFILFSLLVAGISALYFGPFLDNFFSYDDFRYIENNFHGLRQLLLGYNTFRVLSNGVWGPLYQLFGFNPFGYSIFSVCLVCINAFLVYQFLLRLFQNQTLAFMSGLLFIASAVGVDTVFWKCASNSLIAFFFYLLTLITYLHFRQSGRRTWLLFSLALFVLAMFSKEDSASLPGIILLMELLVLAPGSFRKELIFRLTLFSAVIVGYLVLQKLVFVMLDQPPELAKFYQIRPLHSLFSGMTAFFLGPDGFLRHVNPLAYLAALAVPASFLLVRDRRFLLFGFGWILVTFLPQSLTSLGQFEPKHLFNSISRYLYIVSLGPAIVYAALLHSFKERFSTKFAYSAIAGFLAFFIWANYTQVQRRGQEWRKDAAPVALFLAELKKVMPSFPPNSYVYVEDPPVGRAYVQQALRASYRNPSITWIVDPIQYRRKAHESAFAIYVDWGYDSISRVIIRQPWP